MKRALPLSIIALSLAAIAPASASGETGSAPGPKPAEPQHHYTVLAGTIVSMDVAGQTITADVHQSPAHDSNGSQGGRSSPTQQVMIKTDSNTKSG